jgi:hypothetical protein
LRQNLRRSEIGPLALPRVDTALDLSSVGEGELARLSHTGFGEIAERDAGTLPSPMKAKELTLRTRGSYTQDETRDRRVYDIEFLARWCQRTKLRCRHSC